MIYICNSPLLDNINNVYKLMQQTIIRFITISSLIILANTVFKPAFAEPKTDQVSNLIKTTADKYLAVIDTNRSTLEKDPLELRKITQQIIEPHVDLYKMARYVMAKEWRKASKNQQDDFVKYFKNMLIDSYGNGLIKLKIKSINIQKAVATKKGRFIVEMNADLEDGTKAKIIYKVFTDKKTGKFKIYDFVIENLSILVNLRNTFKSEFQSKGVDKVLEEMQQKYS